MIPLITGNLMGGTPYLAPYKVTEWDKRFLAMAQMVSTWSKDPSTQVGTVITQGKRLISVGFNGLPPGIQDTGERLHNRELKYKIIIHGELNAMHFAERSLVGCTLYTFPFMPCSVCASQVIARGIKTVITPYVDNERWNASFKLTEELFKEAGVALHLV